MLTISVKKVTNVLWYNVFSSSLGHKWVGNHLQNNLTKFGYMSKR
jgi:hypothetical protein